MIIICSELNYPKFFTNNWGYLYKIQIVSLFSKFYFLSTLINIIPNFLLNSKLNYICVPITCNNQLKACFTDKKYFITIQTGPTQKVKVCFLLKSRFLTEF